MYSAKRHLHLGYGLTTFAAVWLAMAVAEMTMRVVHPGLGSAAASLLVYAALIAAYARWTESGRRSTAAYLLAGCFPPFVCSVLLVALLQVPSSSFENGGAIAWTGVGVGFQPHGGPDMPIEGYLIPMWLNLLVPMVAILGGRAAFRYARPG
jgi:hypothetical protein